MLDLGVKIFFNAPLTPALNLIELVFGDLKEFLRKKNKNT